MPEHGLDRLRPLVLEALRELVGLLLGGLPVLPHLLPPGLGRGVEPDQVTIFGSQSVSA